MLASLCSSCRHPSSLAMLRLSFSSCRPRSLRVDATCRRPPSELVRGEFIIVTNNPSACLPAVCAAQPPTLRRTSCSLAAGLAVVVSSPLALPPILPTKVDMLTTRSTSPSSFTPVHPAFLRPDTTYRSPASEGFPVVDFAPSGIAPSLSFCRRPVERWLEGMGGGLLRYRRAKFERGRWCTLIRARQTRLPILKTLWQHLPALPTSSPFAFRLSSRRSPRPPRPVQGMRLRQLALAKCGAQRDVIFARYCR